MAQVCNKELVSELMVNTPDYIARSGKQIDESLVDDLVYLFRSIRTSRKGSIGAMNNTYICQLDVRYVDRLADRLQEAIKE